MLSKCVKTLSPRRRQYRQSSADSRRPSYLLRAAADIADLVHSLPRCVNSKVSSKGFTQLSRAQPESVRSTQQSLPRGGRSRTRGDFLGLGHKERRRLLNFMPSKCPPKRKGRKEGRTASPSTASGVATDSHGDRGQILHSPHFCSASRIM